MQPFLRNAWYLAAWSEDLTETPLGRRFLDEPVVLYRKRDGEAVAIGGRCPHRFAPLHLGHVVGDALQCPYHGLRFDASGSCVHNPHGDGRIPQSAKVKSYPAVERHGALWLWMGDEALADPSKIIDITELTATGNEFRTVRGYLHVKANYQVVIDNLLDLSHAQFIHKAFRARPDANAVPPRYRQELKHDGDTVTMYFWAEGGSINPFYAMQWGADAPAVGDVRNHMRWDAPAILQLDAGMTTKGGDRETGPSAPSCHLLTPETSTTTHYFWCVSHDTQTDNPAITDLVKAVITDAFVNEDEPILAACQDLMDGKDLMELSPVILPGDAAAIRARMVLSQLIKNEAQGARSERAGVG